MIIDCHTHIWQSPDQLGQAELGAVAHDPSRVRTGASRASVPPRTRLPHPSRPAIPSITGAQTGNVDKSIVLGFKSRIPASARFPTATWPTIASRQPGQADRASPGIDPTERIRRSMELRLATRRAQASQGVTFSPANQDFHPTDTRAMKVYAAGRRSSACRSCFIPAASSPRPASSSIARPYLLDEVAQNRSRACGSLIAQLGQPWVDEIDRDARQARVTYLPTWPACSRRPWAGVRRAGRARISRA